MLFFIPMIYLKKFDETFKKEYNRYDRIFYKKGDWWVDIFLETGKIATAFKVEKEWKDILYKGEEGTFQIYTIKRFKDGYEITRDDRETKD